MEFDNMDQFQLRYVAKVLLPGTIYTNVSFYGLNCLLLEFAPGCVVITSSKWSAITFVVGIGCCLQQPKADKLPNYFETTQVLTSRVVWKENRLKLLHTESKGMGTIF